jgi:hypothetical protein
LTRARERGPGPELPSYYKPELYADLNAHINPHINKERS